MKKRVRRKRKYKRKLKKKFHLDEKPHPEQTICEIHRRMYRIIVARDTNDPLLPLLQTAFDMAKKMNNRLRQYKENYDDGWWKSHRLDGGKIEESDAA